MSQIGLVRRLRWSIPMDMVVAPIVCVATVSSGRLDATGGEWI